MIPRMAPVGGLLMALQDAKADAKRQGQDLLPGNYTAEELLLLAKNLMDNPSVVMAIKMNRSGVRDVPRLLTEPVSSENVTSAVEMLILDGVLARDEFELIRKFGCMPESDPLTGGDG